MTETSPAFFARAPGLRLRAPLAWDAPTRGLMTLRHLDNDAVVELELNAGVVPFPAEMRTLMPKAVSGEATPAELARFGELWQGRVRAMLLEHAADGALLQIL